MVFWGNTCKWWGPSFPLLPHQSQESQWGLKWTNLMIWLNANLVRMIDGALSLLWVYLALEEGTGCQSSVHSTRWCWWPSSRQSPPAPACPLPPPPSPWCCSSSWTPASSWSRRWRKPPGRWTSSLSHGTRSSPGEYLSGEGGKVRGKRVRRVKEDRDANQMQLVVTTLSWVHWTNATCWTNATSGDNFENIEPYHSEPVILACIRPRQNTLQHLQVCVVCRV